jgi:hypothetical protein
MVREEKRPQRYYIEGILSFVKGCEQLVFGARGKDRLRFNLQQNSENPAAYAKLSCHLPWVADQYGLSYDGVPDPSCSTGTGPTVPFNSTHKYDAVCRNTLGSDSLGREEECIFPFYYRGKGPYTTCMLFEEDDFVYPVFRCPIRNITTKFPGTEINHFEETLELTKGYCIDQATAIATCDGVTVDGGPGCIKQLDPSITDCGNSIRLQPFSTCKNDCPGVRSFGIIGGGAVLFAATSLAGQAILPAIGIGGAGAAAAGATRATCNPPFCVARSGQCCVLQVGPRGRPRCPRSC